MNHEKPKRLATRDVILEFGKHKDVRIQRVPVSYLFFMVRNQTRQWLYAEAELDRRGTVIPQIEVSSHAIDRASLRIRKIRHEHRGKDEGLHAWLARASWDAWNLRQSEGSYEVLHLGVKWCFKLEGVWPVLLTVMPSRRSG